jgi:hypothetical protein
VTEGLLLRVTHLEDTLAVRVDRSNVRVFRLQKEVGFDVGATVELFLVSGLTWH